MGRSIGLREPFKRKTEFIGYLKPFSDHPYVAGIALSLLLFLLWESTNFLVFDLFIIPYFSGAENTLGIVRNLANAIVISTIVVVFGTYAVKQENKKSREISEILNNMSDGLIEVGLKDKLIRRSNNKIRFLLRVPDHVDLLGRSITEIIPAARATGNVAEFLTTLGLLDHPGSRGFRNKETFLKSSDGEMIPVLASSEYLPTKRSFILVFTDIRDLRRAQEQIRQLMHVEKVSGLGHLVAGIGHEINNPLSYLIGDNDRLSAHVHQLLALGKKYETLEKLVNQNESKTPGIKEELRNI
ncbi:MAG TPA: hypothetical protein VJ044_15475, partial [Candidatus Hodarchaeales archaeon]|nr:hypothetical protein [Candidatus Hodarchaeales archaeon]